MNVDQIIDQLRQDTSFCKHLTAWRTFKPRAGTYAAFPDSVNPALIEGFRKRGITQLYTHQRDAFTALESGKHVCVVTPTASGKTLCYNLPVLNQLLKDENSRALYLFPTKALSHDQVVELTDTIEALDVKIGAYTFDGDTPSSARKSVRTAGNIVVTNPDMLHAGILPHHTIWIRLFENLRYVVIDEIHQYRGVFGSHLANVLRRLKRICAFYGSSPQFICCSATIANPQELAENLVEMPVELVSNNGAPSGEKHFLFFNPPVVNYELGIRASSVKQVGRLAASLLFRNVQSIIFARSRLRVELITTYLKKAVAKKKGDTRKVRGYRGGYLPTERREIEQGLRKGDVIAVVSTNALELGIDIGSLDVCIMCGYAGGVARTWQQAGRAGRRNSAALVILVASSAPLDQYIISHPDYFFTQTVENATIDSNNLFVLTSHLKCAAFELPFNEGDCFGLDAKSTEELLDFLAEIRILRKVKKRWHWSAETYPASDISLRTAAPGNIVILDTTDNGRVIGEVDYFNAPVEVYQNAVYLHETRQYTIEQLDMDDRKAYARPVDVDYYTDAELKVDLRVINRIQESGTEMANTCMGELSVTWLPTIYKKIKFGTHENVGWGNIDLPEQTMHTTGFWIEFPEDIETACGLGKEALGEALHALSNALRQVAPIHVVCDPSDMLATFMLRAPESQKPSIFLYERYPGGVGYSEKLYTHYKALIAAAMTLLTDCPCKAGCPSCVGPALETSIHGKTGALTLAQFALMKPGEANKHIDPKTIPQTED
ncbi:MAG: DEAD/DEAH box helicase [Candidatus Hydrogenedentes bacterium]|nr:DEAD/DEAH box helicase [Candidatus Hydrogenedentota bacterium]